MGQRYRRTKRKRKIEEQRDKRTEIKRDRQDRRTEGLKG
jgi:hypothetical protein